jgi:hypothetical protein
VAFVSRIDVRELEAARLAAQSALASGTLPDSTSAGCEAAVATLTRQLDCGADGVVPTPVFARSLRSGDVLVDTGRVLPILRVDPGPRALVLSDGQATSLKLSPRAGVLAFAAR